MALTFRSNPFTFISFHRIAGNLFFLVLLIYSIVYAAERITYVDSAWQFFTRVNNEGFFFPSGRYGVFLSELPLFFAVKIGLPFNALVYVFSSGYIILYFLVWAICTYKLKNPAAGLLIIFSTFMGVREGFLHPVTETQQCLVYSALLFAFLIYDFDKNIIKSIFVCATTLLILFTHPIGVFMAGFSVLFYMIDKRQYRKKLPWMVIAILFIVCLFRFLSPTDPYDAVQYAQLKNSSGNSSSFSDSHALAFLLMHFKHFYWLPELAGLIAAIWLTIQKEWLKLAALAASVAAYIYIASITFHNGDASIMLERIFLPAFFMINLVLADLLFKTNRINKFIPMILVVFFMVNGIHYINWGCLYYKKRVAYLDTIVSKGIAQGNDVYFLSSADANADKEKILGHWALGVETLIYSKFKYDKCISISIEGEICDAGNCRITSMLCIPDGDLNPHYFHLSGKAYQVLK